MNLKPILIKLKCITVRAAQFFIAQLPYQLRFAEPVKISENKQSFHSYSFLDAR